MEKHYDTEDLTDFLKAAGRAGGHARAKELTGRQRSEIASKAARARWEAKVPLAHHTGTIRIGTTELDCAVLDDGTRLVSQGHILQALGRSASTGRRRNDAAITPPFLSASNLRPFVSPELEAELKPIEYRTEGSKPVATGYPAATLPMICEVYLAADDAGRLLPSQQKARDAASVLIRGLARVGITALVDEATGYQDVRDRDELQRLLESYVEEAFHPWVKRFPDEFFKEIYRIYRLSNTKHRSNHPQFIGNFINDYVYGALPSGVLDELRRVNPANESGNRPRKHHQHLTQETGNRHLDLQIATVITLMKISSGKEEFKALFKKRFPRAKRVLTVVDSPSDGEPPTLFELEPEDKEV
jgi:hypothetical protein